MDLLVREVMICVYMPRRKKASRVLRHYGGNGCRVFIEVIRYRQRLQSYTFVFLENGKDCNANYEKACKPSGRYCNETPGEKGAAVQRCTNKRLL